MLEHEKNVSTLCKTFKKMIYYVSLILYANFHLKNPIRSYIYQHATLFYIVLLFGPFLFSVMAFVNQMSMTIKMN